MLATSYLPRRWPAKYCHRCESFRPCSGWEREFSSLLATSESFRYAESYIEYKLTQSQFLPFILEYCSTLRCHSLHFAFAKYPLVSSALLRVSLASLTSLYANSARKSPRPISNARLKMLPFLHLRPIYQVICLGTY